MLIVIFRGSMIMFHPLFCKRSGVHSLGHRGKRRGGVGCRHERGAAPA